MGGGGGGGSSREGETRPIIRCRRSVGNLIAAYQWGISHIQDIHSCPLKKNRRTNTTNYKTGKHRTGLCLSVITITFSRRVSVCPQYSRCIYSTEKFGRPCLLLQNLLDERCPFLLVTLSRQTLTGIFMKESISQLSLSRWCEKHCQKVQKICFQIVFMTKKNFKTFNNIVPV